MPGAHYIGKQVIDVRLQGRQDGFELQQRISRLCRELLHPALDELFSRYAGPDEVIRLERLEVDLGSMDSARFQDEFVRKVRQALRDQLDKILIVERRGFERLSSAQNHFSQWLHFLEKGYLPWNGGRATEEERQRAVLESLAADPPSVSRFKALLRERPATLRRLALQSPEPFLVQLLEAVAARKYSRLPGLRAEMERACAPGGLANDIAERKSLPSSSSEVKLLFWGAALEIALLKEDPEPLMQTARQWISYLLESGSGQAFFQKLQKEKAGFPILTGLLPALAAGAPAEEPRQRSAPPDEPAAEDATAKGRKKKEKGPAEKPMEKPEEKGPAEVREDSKADAKTEAETPFKLEKARGKDQSPGDGSLEAEAGLPPEEAFPESEAPDFAEFSSRMEGEEFYLRNAGVVLLHPFLPAFFGRLGWVQKGEFTDEAARHRAIHMIQYLATRESGLPEYELLLPKFLCAQPFDVPLSREVTFSAEELAEAENLLASAISHWGKLGSSGPDALREGFLQREGKLSRRPNGWYLQVEQQTIDVLLDQLPWTLGIVRLPWMPEILRVEWA